MRLLFAALDRGDVRFKEKKFQLDMKHCESQPVKLSIEKAQNVELKSLPPYMRYVFYEKGDTLPVIIASDLYVHQVESFAEVLKGFKRAIGWNIAYIIGSLSGLINIKSNSLSIIRQVLSTGDV